MTKAERQARCKEGHEGAGEEEEAAFMHSNIFLEKGETLACTLTVLENTSPPHFPPRLRRLRRHRRRRREHGGGGSRKESRRDLAQEQGRWQKRKQGRGSGAGRKQQRK